MKPWTVDADDIKIADDFDDRLLYRTPLIDDFLLPGREDKFIVIGTKGFGKTLLLKAKRIQYQGASHLLCIPENGLLDKPVGDKIFSKDMLELFAHSTEWWCRVWLMSIATATLKRLDLVSDLRVHPRLIALLEDQNLRGVIDHFVNLLDLPRHELYRCATDTDNHLVPRLRALNTPVAIFIDNVDEYFNKHVKTTRRSSDVGETSPSIWYYSQMGLVEVAYQLRRISHHLKVFAAVRKEAFLRFNEDTSMVQQYRGSAVDISYSATSLKEIFINNIRREKERNLVAPDRLRATPLEAFLGVSTLPHAYTHEDEDVFDYIARHTLLRPRDLMTIGQRLSDIAPAERRNQDRIKTVINQGATEIANEYLNEIAPYLGDVDITRALSRLRANVLERDEIEEIFDEHNLGVASGMEREHIFCMLYRAGLLGWIHTDLVTQRRVQRFLSPGEGTFQPDGVLPLSSHYVVHPVLSEIITRLNPAFARRIDSTNIVGRGRPWREASDREPRELMVLRADIKGFGRLMAEGADQQARELLRRAVSAYTADCMQTNLDAGDSLTIVDDRILVLVKAARRIIEEVSEARGSPRLRVAIAGGPVVLRHRGEGQPGIVSGKAVLLASRVEPLVAPGEVWVTDSARAALEQVDTVFRVEPIPPFGEPAMRRDNGQVNVRKPGSDDEDMWVRLYRVVT